MASCQDSARWHYCEWSPVCAIEALILFSGWSIYAQPLLDPKVCPMAAAD
jgi:hypothetical protein